MSYDRPAESQHAVRKTKTRIELSPKATRLSQGRVSSIFQLQRTIGNRRVAQLIQAKRLATQAKMNIQRKMTGAVIEPSEQEADHIAHEVTCLSGAKPVHTKFAVPSTVSFAARGDLESDIIGTNADVSAHELTHVVQQTAGAPLQKKKKDGLISAETNQSVERPYAASQAGRIEEKESDSNSDGLTAQRGATLMSMSILALQRNVENVAAQKLLKSTPQRNPVIQRQPSSSPNQQAQEPQGYVTLPDLRVGAVLLGPALRGKMNAIVRQGSNAQKKRSELEGLVEYLKMAADANGPAAARSVSAVRSTAKGLTGNRRESLEAAIDKYDTSKPNLRTIMSEIEAARSTIVASTKRIESKVLGKKLIETHRAEEKTKGDLEKLEEKRAGTNKILSGFISFSAMLIDPTKGWSTALMSATSMVGNYIEDLTLGGSYAEQIDTIRGKLTALTRSIQGLEDAQALADIDEAAALFQAAQKTLQARLEELVGAVYAAEVAQDDMQRELRKLGKRGALAAEALSEGSAVIEIGNEAITKSMAQQSALESLKADIAYTFKQSDDYRRMLEHEGTNLSIEQRSWARDAAIQNVRAAQSWDRWVTAELVHLAEDQKFLSARSYQVGYEQGVEAALKKIRLR
jgi:hypothetical protein